MAIPVEPKDEDLPRAVFQTMSQARAASLEPLVVLQPLEALLDDMAIGFGPIDATPLGNGHSNVTYVLRRGGERVVLRRPPRPPFPPSAHDVIREASIIGELNRRGLPVPEVLASVADPTALGVPFVLLEHVEGVAIDTELPVGVTDPTATRTIGLQLVDALAAVHEVDVVGGPLAALGRPGGYLERQISRFRTIWQDVATRSLPQMDEVGDWLHEHRPEQRETTLVHGDFRLGNVLFDVAATPRLTAILDWEMATLGDPLADLGYLCATWAEDGDEGDPMLDLSAATRAPGFPSRRELAAHYAGRTGRDVSRLGWYEVLARWKCATFLEASYRRFVGGGTRDPYFASLGDGVPRLVAAAVARIEELT